MTSEDETRLDNKLESLVQIHSCLSIFARLGARPMNTEISVSLRTSLLWTISRDQSQTINSTECSGRHNGPEPVCSPRRSLACLLCDLAKSFPFIKSKFCCLEIREVVLKS